jgi:tRNA threonylcarbamoyladenosine biosynthesis protein TsaB
VQEIPLAAVLQAGRGRIAVGWYKASENGWQAEGTIEATTADKLAESIHHPTLIVGELNAEERQRLSRKRKNILLASPAQSARRPALLAELAWARWQSGQADDAASLAPIYLHVEGGLS